MSQRTCLAIVLAGGAELAVGAGPNPHAVAGEAKHIAPQAEVFEQRERLGTAHAVLSARAAIARKSDDVLVMFADTPLVQAETLSRLRDALAQGAAVAVLGFKPADPKGYGRLVMRGDEIFAIREERDASDD